MSDSEGTGLSPAIQAAVSNYQENFKEPSEVAVEGQEGLSDSIADPEVYEGLANSLGIKGINREVSDSEESGHVDEASDADSESDENQDSEEDSDAKEDNPDTEMLEVDGKNLTIKYNDRDWIKKTAKTAIHYQKGMRQFQSERDAARAELETLKPEAEKYQQGFNKLQALHDEAVADGNWEPFFNTMVGDSTTFQDIIAEHIDKSDYLSSLTDEERSSYDANVKERKRVRQLEAELEEFKKETESKSKAADNTKSEALKVQVQGDVNSAFQEYKFKTELQDSKDLHDLNKTLFERFNNELDEYSMEDISIELIHKVMKQESEKLRKLLNLGKARKNKNKVARRKEVASKELQKAVASNEPKAELLDMVSSGDIHGALTNAIFRNKN